VSVRITGNTGNWKCTTLETETLKQCNTEKVTTEKLGTLDLFYGWKQENPLEKTLDT